MNEDCNGAHLLGAVEWEHAFMYAGKQVNEWWAIVPVCWHHHRGGGLDKEFNRYRALVRMDEEDLREAKKKYPRVDWASERSRLIRKYS
jgi:hypothetical protein